MTTLNEWQLRVVKEQTKLGNKIEKLENFLQKDLSGEVNIQDVLLLETQLSIMNSYYEILGRRIARFNLVVRR